MASLNVVLSMLYRKKEVLAVKEGVSQRELAEAMGFRSFQSWQNIRDKGTVPKREILLKICSTLNVSEQEILDAKEQGRKKVSDFPNETQERLGAIRALCSKGLPTWVEKIIIHCI